MSTYADAMGVYRRMQQRTADHVQALERTNLALRLYQRRYPDVLRAHEDNPWPLLTMFWNHLLQCHYRRSGIDVTPGSVDTMFPYYVAVADLTKPKDQQERSTVTCQSTRIDAPWSVPEVERRPTVLGSIRETADPLFGLDIAVSQAVGDRFLPKAKRSGPFQYDHAVYLAVSQIVTLLVCMGVVRTGLRGVGVDMTFYGADDKRAHPLRILGMEPEPTFTSEWYGLGETPAYDGLAFIHRTTGNLVLAARPEVVPYRAWCNGSIDRGLEYLLSELG